MIENDNYDLIFKLVLIGDSGVGKTNILSRYIKNEFSIATKSTVGVEFGSKIIKKEDKTIKRGNLTYNRDSKFGIQPAKKDTNL